MGATQAWVPPVERAFVEGFAQRWLDAWNSHDAEAVLAFDR
jgi:hypothetical protein